MNNYFADGYLGIYLLRFSNLQLQDNTLEDMYGGFDLNSGNGSLEISGNRLTNCYTGINAQYLSSNTTVPHIFNNIISSTGYYGMSVYGTDLLIMHNSVVNSSAESYNRFAAVISGTGNQVRKNHFICSGAAIALSSSAVDPTSNQRNIIEHNNVYSYGLNVAKISNDSYKELSLYNAYTQTDNVSYNPFFSGEFLSPTSAAMDNLYPSTAVTVDYNGFTRSLSNSDIGAHEYSAGAGMTPMSGTYTIGSAEDFSTLQEFCNALAQRGVCAAVNGNLTQTLYEEQVVLHAIPNASEANLVTLRSVTAENSTLSYSDQTAAAPYVMNIIRSSYVKLSNLFFSTTAVANSNLLLLSGYNHDLDLQFIHFTAPANTGGISLGTLYGSEAKNIDLFSGVFSGNGYGIGSYGENWSVYGSSFDDQYYSIYAQSTNGYRVENSTFTNARYNHINISSSVNVSILQNRITGTKTGIALHCSGTASIRSLVANNTVKLIGGGTNGITVAGNMISVLNNSVQVQGENAKAFYVYELGTDLDIVNNIFASTLGHAMDIGYFTPAANKIVDYNCYYSEGSQFVKMGTEYASLSTLQSGLPDYNQHSIGLNPHFTADLHTESPWLRQVGMFRTEITTDMDNEPRGSVFDIGADQQTGAIVDNRLAGTYTIGAVACDFATMEAAIEALELYGIRESVTFNITLGTYPGYNEITDFPKASSNLHVYFNALNGVTFRMQPENTYAYENYFFRLVGVKNIHFSGLDMALIPANHQSTFFVLDGRCEGVSISESSFNMTNAQTSSNTGISTGDFQGIDLSVSECTFTGGSTGINIPGYYWASLSYTGIDVLDNTFTNVGYPISIQKAVDVKISGNEMLGATQAIGLSYITGDNEISNNKILSSGYAGSYSTGTAVSLSNCNGSIYNGFRILNNIIKADQSSAQSVIALSIYNSSHLYLNHNTIISDNSTFYEYGCALALSNVSLSSFWNNIISAPTSGYAVTLSQCTDYVFQNNAWYNSAKHLATESTNKYTAEEFLALMDPNGYYANPLQNAEGYTQCTYLRNKAASSSSIADIDGNLWNGTPDLGATTIADTGSPLSGTVYVGSGESFTDLAMVWDALQKRGISANVTLQLAPGAMNTSLTMGYIPNTLTNSITINGGVSANAPILQKTATSDADNYILKLYNTRNLSLTNLAFSAGNAYYSKAIEMQRYIKDLVIDNCSFTTPANTQSNYNSAALYTSGAILDNVQMSNCMVVNLPYGISISASQQSGMLNSGLVLSDNTFSNNYQGIYLSYVAAPLLERNIIQGFRNMGLSISSGITDLSMVANQVTGNGQYGVRLYNLGSGTHLVANNYIRTGQNVSSSLYLENSPNVDMIYNTIINSSSSGSATAFYQNASSPGLAFQNNICVAAAGYAAWFNQLADFQAGMWTHNLYHSLGANTVKLGSININNSTVWNSNTGDQYSVFADPLLQDNSFELTAGSPARFAGIIYSGIGEDIVGDLRNNPPAIGCRESNFTSLASPQNVIISVSPLQQTVTLTWDLVPGAGLYYVQTATDPYAQSWIDIPGASTGQLSITIPMDGSNRFYRVKAMGPE
ncbi:MAG: right-handed parallel beta-helix repeat-containing protein [Candidatus Cloacimonetes bacterium]|nr:right-handed parallel beta-helix repeat-containing protein [Candidatus Cloacimonadota bacterium]